MLRIERHPYSREITLKMHKRSSGFGSRDLWIGLGIALVLHLGAILLFRFPIINLKDLGVPAHVVVEAYTSGNQMPGTRADWTPHPNLRLLPEELLAPRSALPPLSAWKPASISKEALVHQLTEMPHFWGLERLTTIAKPPASPLPSIPPSMAIKVSGPLAEYPFELLNTPAIEPQSGNRYSFDVRVDNHTGRICCFSSIYSDEDLDPAINSLAEKILTQLYFKLGNRPTLVPGFIEVSFSASQENML